MMALDALLACPSCRGSLSADVCGDCGARYPSVDGIPWFLPDPSASLGEWRARLKHLVQRLEGEANILKSELKNDGLPELTSRRLRKLLQAKVEHRKSVVELLGPLELAPQGSEELSRAMSVRVPATQTLTSYYGNIHRDWSWETSENAESLKAVQDAIPAGHKLDKVLVLGAGAGRLAYDLHLAHAPDLTVVTDINPLMLLIAKRMFKGKNVKLYEFPLAPVDLESQAVLRKCAAPAAAPANLELAFADALAPPFKPGVFDTVLTPWLIDIMPVSLDVLAQSINPLLKGGGVWLNFGTLGFNHAQAAWNYSLEEMLEVVNRQGFELKEAKRMRIPYMQSPASGHGRIELVTSYGATKVKELAPAVARRFLPDWLVKSDVPVPRSRTFDTFAAVHGILLDAVALIDGKRSLRDLAEVFGQKHGLKADEAEASLRSFLTRQFEDSLVGQSW